MKRTYAWRNNQLVELTPQDIETLPQVMDDVQEFRSPDGVQIRGRAQWREHLAKTGAIELGHSDIKVSEEKWRKKKADFAEKVRSGQEHVREVPAPEGEILPAERKQISVEIANRLYNRPMPDRKTMIKLTLETARDLARRRH